MAICKCVASREEPGKPLKRLCVVLTGEWNGNPDWVPTLCGMGIICSGGIEEKEPNCPECLAVLKHVARQKAKGEPDGTAGSKSVAQRRGRKTV